MSYLHGSRTLAYYLVMNIYLLCHHFIIHHAPVAEAIESNVLAGVQTREFFHQRFHQRPPAPAFTNIANQ